MRPQISPSTHPTLSGRERAFFDYWLENVGNPDDPHIQRWTDYEEGAVDRGRERTIEIERFSTVAGKDVLEIGCQNGAWLIALAQAGANAVGIEIVAPAVDAAKVRAECWDVTIDAQVGDACALEFASETFDIVASNDVIEHVPDKEAMVREIMRVLRPGGIAVISAPQRFSVKHLISDPHYHYAGVSVFPAPMISWYLTKFRGESVYEVETLPTAYGIRKLFRKYGGVVLGDDAQPLRPPAGAGDRVKTIARGTKDELRQGFVIGVRKPE